MLGSGLIATPNPNTALYHVMRRNGPLAMIQWTGARAPLRAVTASSKLASIRVIQTTSQPHNIQFLKHNCFDHYLYP